MQKNLVLALIGQFWQISLFFQSFLTVYRVNCVEFDRFRWRCFSCDVIYCFFCLYNQIQLARMPKFSWINHFLSFLNHYHLFLQVHGKFVASFVIKVTVMVDFFLLFRAQWWCFTLWLRSSNESAHKWLKGHL